MATIPIRVFISSPGDVGQERMIASRVLDRLQGEFANYIDITTILWEHEPLRATSHFQQQIVPPSQTDIVVCILWSRLGTRLPDQFKRADGSSYASGTEWEFEDAYRSFSETGKPDLLVYRKMTEPIIDFHDEKAARERLAQKKALDEFIDRWFGNAATGFKAAFLGFNDADEFESTIDTHLRKLIREKIPERVVDDDGASINIIWFKGSPYRGLEAFDVEHAPVFFGRTKQIGAVKEALIRQHANGCAFVIVFGMSGGGKSSLIRAGLLPTLMHPGVIEGVGYWRRIIFRPSDAAGDLFNGFAQAFFEENGLPELISASSESDSNQDDSKAAISKLAELLRTDPSSAIGEIKSALDKAAKTYAANEKLTRPPLARIIVYIDQMEEIFTREGHDEQVREKFVAALGVLARCGSIWVVASMRSDYYPRCAEIPELVTMKEGAGQYDLLPPTFAEIGQMIRYPTRAAGLRFEGNAVTGVGLDDVLHEAASRDPEALPLLEFTLDELFQRRSEDGVLTFAAYESLGGMEGALAQRAEEVFTSLSPKVQNEIGYLLQNLVTVGNTGDKIATSRRVRLSVIGNTNERRIFIDAFVKARLLITDRADDGQPVVRVAHEALLHRWPRVLNWVAEHQDLLRTRDRVATNAIHWSQEGRTRDLLLPQGKLLAEAEDLISQNIELEPLIKEFVTDSRRAIQRSIQRRMTVVIGITVAFFSVVSGFGVFSYSQWKIAEHQKNMALEFAQHLTYDIPSNMQSLPGSRPILREIFEKNANLLNQISDLRAEREQGINLRYMGDLWMKLGDTDKAKEAYAGSVAIARKLAKSDNDRKSQADLAVSLRKNGDIDVLTNDVNGALSFYNESKAILQDLINNSPNKQDKWKLQRDMSSCYEAIGDANLNANNLDAALKAYSADLDLAQQLAAADPSPQRQEDLAVSLTRVGDTQLALSNADIALSYYQNAFNILSALPKNLSSQRSLVSAYAKIGQTKIAKGDAKDAVRELTTGLAIAQTLAEDKSNIEVQHDLLVIYRLIANARMSIGDTNGAVSAYKQAFPIAQFLARDKDNAMAQSELTNIEQTLQSLGVKV